MSRNLVKSYYTTKESSAPRVIDSNAVIEQLLEQMKNSYDSDNGAGGAGGFEALDLDVYEEQEGEYSEGLDAEMLNGLIGDNSEENTEGNVSGLIKAKEVEAGPTEEEMRAEVEALRHRLIEETLADIAAMKDQAVEEIARDKAAAMEEARSAGYQDGINRAYAELENDRQQFENEKQRYEQEYADMLFELEPKFVRYITNIYEKVFQVDLTEERDIVVNLLRTAMQKVEGSKNYMIHVSKEDYRFVYDRKKELADAAMAEDAIIDVVEDLTMKSGDCFIETSNGIFDCGIETQLTALKKKLMLLAYDGR